MKFKNFSFFWPGKSWNLIISLGKLWKIEVLVSGSFFTATKPFWCLLNSVSSKNTLKQGRF